MFVFVLDSNKEPLNLTHPARARKLLKTGKAAVFKRYPFTIIARRSQATCSEWRAISPNGIRPVVPT